MFDIDYIMNLLNWNNSEEEQLLGRKLSQNITCIDFFMQPGKPYGKSVWDNCAMILSERSNEDLKPYLIELLAWLQDMNWPGAFCILDRIKKFERDIYFNFVLRTCIKIAKAIDDPVWEENLREII